MDEILTKFDQYRDKKIKAGISEDERSVLSICRRRLRQMEYIESRLVFLIDKNIECFDTGKHDSVSRISNKIYFYSETFYYVAFNFLKFADEELSKTGNDDFKKIKNNNKKISFFRNWIIEHPKELLRSGFISDREHGPRIGLRSEGQEVLENETEMTGVDGTENDGLFDHLRDFKTILDSYLDRSLK